MECTRSSSTVTFWSIKDVEWPVYSAIEGGPLMGYVSNWAYDRFGRSDG